MSQYIAIEDISPGDCISFFGKYVTVISNKKRRIVYRREDGSIGELQASAGDQLVVVKRETKECTEKSESRQEEK